MSELDPEISGILAQGEKARLIPVAAETSKEHRITSALLAVMMSVDEFSKSMLQIVGAPAPKIARIKCFSEIIFKTGKELDRKLRPDGLIYVKAGSRTWSAIVEAKVGGAELGKEQVEAYLDIAKANKVDAVITISNQFAPLPTHYPIQINKQKTKSVELYHWSWTSIMSEAILISDYKGVSDPDQAFILQEFVRYLKHESSGVQPFPKLGKGWKEICANVQNAVPLTKNSDAVIDTIGEWHQLAGFLSLELGMAVGRNVSVYMSRAHAKDPDRRMQESIVDFTQTKGLEAEFDIPDAAARVKVNADVKRRTLSASMRLNAPKDRARATALVTWLLRQLKNCTDDQLLIRADWPGRAPRTGATLGQLREDPKVILNPNHKILPVAFEVVRVLDVGARFIGPKAFVEDIDRLLLSFYGDVGQYLKAWVPQPPKVEKMSESEELIEELIEISEAQIAHHLSARQSID